MVLFKVTTWHLSGKTKKNRDKSEIICVPAQTGTGNFPNTYQKRYCVHYLDKWDLLLYFGHHTSDSKIHILQIHGAEPSLRAWDSFSLVWSSRYHATGSYILNKKSEVSALSNPIYLTFILILPPIRI